MNQQSPLSVSVVFLTKKAVIVSMKWSKTKNFYSINLYFSNRRFVHHLPCLGFVRQDTMIWQVLTMYDCTLREFLQRTCVGQGKPKHHTLYTCMDQVVSGLEFLHRKDLVHIDLSLDTILVSVESVPWVNWRYGTTELSNNNVQWLKI